MKMGVHTTVFEDFRANYDKNPTYKKAVAHFGTRHGEVTFMAEIGELPTVADAVNLYFGLMGIKKGVLLFTREPKHAAYLARNFPADGIPDKPNKEKSLKEILEGMVTDELRGNLDYELVTRLVNGVGEPGAVLVTRRVPVEIGHAEPELLEEALR